MLTQRRAERVAVALAVLVLAAIVADVVLLLSTRRSPSDPGLFAADAVLGAGFAIAAAAIVRRQPQNRLAWLFLVIAIGFADYVLFSDIAEWLWDEGAVESYPWVKLVGYMGGEVAWPMMWLIGQAYPTGRPLPGLGWRILWRASLAWLAFGFISTIFSSRSTQFDEWHTENPLALFPALADVPPWFGLVTVSVIFGGAIASLVVRFARSTGAERQQMKIFVVALVLFPLVSFGPIWLDDGEIGANGPWVWPALGAAIIPVALGLAVLRYRLWDVDRLVSRTFGYALTSAALLGLYVGAVTLLTRLLPLPDTVAIGFGVLAAATLFHPLRRRVQREVDRRFDRGRFNAEATLAAFRSRLLDSMTEDAVRQELLDAVATYLQPTRTLILLPGTDRPAGQ